MTIKLTYEQVLAKASPSLKKKMVHSVELLRKSEKLALKYSPDGFIVGFSGGKDSQAVLHLCQLAGVKHQGWFSPTSVDPSEVIRFIRTQYPEVKWTKLEMSIYEHSVRQGCLPTMRIRHCCAAFKENKHPNTVTIVGVRREESVRRAKRNEVEVSGHKYSGDLDGFELWSEKRIERIKKRYRNLNQDQFAEPQSESTIRCVGGKDNIIILPILEWSDSEVWEFLNDVLAVPHCSLYDEGRKRIGCIMCPFSSTKSIMADIRRWPHVYWKWVEVVRAIREGRVTLRNTPPASQSDSDEVSTPPQSEQLRTVEHGMRKRQGPTTSAKSESSAASAPPQIADQGPIQLQVQPGLLQPTYSTMRTLLQSSGGYSRATKEYQADSTDCKQRTTSSISTQWEGVTNPFLPSPTGKGYINTPEEMIVSWWISKLPFKEWYAKNFLTNRIDFDKDQQ